MRAIQRMMLTGVLILTASCSTAAEGSESPTSPAAQATPSSSTGGASPSVIPSPVSTQDADAAREEVPSRIVVPALSIDLPVVSGDLVVPGNARDYPLCDVAQYLTTYRHPDRIGTTTWIYAHARPGMFLSLLEISEKDDGAALIGSKVEVYSTAGHRYTYRVTEVLRHAVDRSLALVSPEARRLVLQTSEGPSGTVPKLQVAADFIKVTPSTTAKSMPSAAPRDCSE